jgi:hypothetical protein
VELAGVHMDSHRVGAGSSASATGPPSSWSSTRRGRQMAPSAARSQSMPARSTPSWRGAGAPRPVSARRDATRGGASKLGSGAVGASWRGR